MSTNRRMVAMATAGLVACGALSVPVVASQAAPDGALPSMATAAPDKATPRRLLLSADGPRRVVADNHVRFTGHTPKGRKMTVALQRRKATSQGPWRTIATRTAAGEFRMRALMPQGRHAFRLSAPAPGPDLRSGGVTLRGAEAPFTALTMPQQQDSQQVLDAIANADQSVQIVVYQLGAQDILAALQQAKKRLAANDPKQPVIRIMTNNQWYSQPKSASNYAYVSKMAKALGVGSNGVSDDGVVQFNYTANNFSLTHQKTILIDTRRPDGSAYSSADQLPDSAQAIVATFNLQAYGWASADTGCSANPQCAFDGASGGTPGARDFGIQVNRPADIWEIEQVFASDFAGPTPTETNQELGLNDPTSNLVWSNGSTGVLFPAPSGTGAETAALFSKAAGAYPAADPDSGVGNGNYPAPYYEFADAAAADPQIRLGTAMGNADAVHLNTIRAATAAAEGGKPATLYIYNEEYDDDAVLDAIQDAAAAGVTVRIMMTYGASNGPSYDFLLTKKRPGGGPVDAQVHLLPNQAPQYRYIHAKMIYADLGGNTSDIAFVGSQNFSENSLLFNREAGVQLKQSDGTLSDGIRQTLLSTFADDFAIDGKGITWNYTDKKTGKRYTNVPCPAVWLSPQTTWKSVSRTLDASGCQLATPSSTGPGGKVDATKPVIGTDFSSLESYRATSYPYFGARGTAQGVRTQYVPTPTFVAPLAGVYSTFTPQMPQGPINPSNMVPGACQVIDQATAASTGPCPSP